MTKRLLLPSLVLATALSGGCGLFSKSAKPKENPGIAGEVEESFRQRWIDRRAAELIAQGTAADAARAQATEEFRAKYNFNAPAKK